MGGSGGSGGSGGMGGSGGSGGMGGSGGFGTGNGANGQMHSGCSFAATDGNPTARGLLVFLLALLPATHLRRRRQARRARSRVGAPRAGRAC
jgi:MYXO-CTERM domain-containing protein